MGWLDQQRLSVKNLVAVQGTRLDISAVPTGHWRPRKFQEKCWSSIYIGIPKKVDFNVSQGWNQQQQEPERNKTDRQKQHFTCGLPANRVGVLPTWKEGLLCLSKVFPGDILINPSMGVSLSWFQIQWSWQPRLNHHSCIWRLFNT